MRSGQKLLICLTLRALGEGRSSPSRAAECPPELGVRHVNRTRTERSPCPNSAVITTRLRKCEIEGTRNRQSKQEPEQRPTAHRHDYVLD
jgi:hypothetical protein